MKEYQKGEIVQRYVDILTNAGFKALFGDENNKDVVMSILNVLLPEHRRVVEIEYMPTEIQGPIINTSKEYHYDFMCKDESGTVFIVELQKYHEADWFQRCVSYASRAYDRQNRKGEDYAVQPVYLIGIMDVEIEHPDKEYWKDRYISEYTFREKECHDLLGETIVIIFAELTRFSKRAEECESELDKMLYVLKHIGRMLDQPTWLQHEVYSRLFAACEICQFSESKRIKYEQDMYDEKRLRGEMKGERQKGREEGLAEGHAKGLAEGLAQSEERLREAAINYAKKLKATDMSVETIAEILELPIEEIESL